jgi:hypothetical protein
MVFATLITESLLHAQDFAPPDAYGGGMKFTGFNRQEIFDAAAWVAAAFLVLALVNALRGIAPPALSANPQLVRQPEPAHGELTAGPRSAQVTRARRR